jgi:hypothetical protein
MRLEDEERSIAYQELALEYWEPALPPPILIRHEPVTVSIPFPKVRFGKRKKSKPEPELNTGLDLANYFHHSFPEHYPPVTEAPPVKLYRGSRYASRVIGKPGGKWKAA